MKIRFGNFRRNVIIMGLLLVAALVFAACGDSATNTPVPAATTAPATSAAATTNAAAGNANGNGANNPAGNPGATGVNRGNFGPPLTGTVESYDAATKSVTIKTTDGQSQKFDATNTRVSKLDKITLDQLGQNLTANDFIQVAGQPGSDGSYNATRLTILDPATAGGFGGNGGQGGFGGNGTPGQGRGQNFTPPANFTPGAGRPGAGRNGAGAGVIIRGGALSGNKLTGTDLSGQAVTVNLTGSTVINKRVQGTADDLKAGENVTVNMRPGQGNTPASAVLITIDE